MSPSPVIRRIADLKIPSYMRVIEPHGLRMIPGDFEVPRVTLRRSGGL